MTRVDFRTAKIRTATHAASTKVARKHRTSMAAVIAAAVERFVKLPPEVISKDIDLHDPRAAQSVSA